MPFRIRPTRADEEIASTIAHRTDPALEQAAQAFTWGADEKVLCALAAAWWLYCQTRGPRDRASASHLLLTSVAVSLIPHALKSVFSQIRPDRLMPRARLHGVPVSGRRLDAFPSGHAMHVGAMASAATVLPPAKRNLVWSFGAALVTTRIVLLAHWASDVAAGLILGGLTERVLRLWTGYGRRPGVEPRQE